MTKPKRKARSARKRAPSKRRRRVRSGNNQMLGTASELAHVLGVSERTVRRQVARGLPVHRPSYGSTPALYDLREVLAWRDARERVRREERDEEALLAGGKDSPWLEECRRQKAIQLRRLNEVEAETLVLAADVGVAFREMGLALRQEFLAVERAHGAAVGEAIRQAIDRAEALWESRLPATCSQTTPTAAGPPADRRPGPPQADLPRTT